MSLSNETHTVRNNGSLTYPSVIFSSPFVSSVQSGFGAVQGVLRARAPAEHGDIVVDTFGSRYVCVRGRYFGSVGQWESEIAVVSSVVNDKAFAHGKGVKGKKKEQVITRRGVFVSCNKYNIMRVPYVRVLNCDVAVPM